LSITSFALEKAAPNLSECLSRNYAASSQNSAPFSNPSFILSTFSAALLIFSST